MEIDKSNMKEVIIESPDQLRKGLLLAENIKIPGRPDNVIICGMGGSALPVNILKALSKTDIPILVHRDYNLPGQAGKNSLIICVSYSGNTEESVSALEEALQKKLKIIGIATGGKIEKICKDNNIPLVKIPSGIQPRSATGYMVSAMAKILSNSGIISDLSEDILMAAGNLDAIMLQSEKEGKELAEKIGSKMPVIYSSNKFKAVSRIWKIKFNENSKTPAFWNYFPELNHNEMVGFSNAGPHAKNLHVVILRDEDDHPRNLKRMELTASLLSKMGVEVDFVDIKEGTMAFKILSALLLGDWASYYLAIKHGIDPTPVELVEEFKKLMEK